MGVACAALCRSAGSINDQTDPAISLLVTGRRGAFPSYRFNGIYRLIPSFERLASEESRTNLREDQHINTLPALPGAVYQRVDRPEVSIRCSDEMCSGDWHCELDGEVIARARKSPSDGRLLVEVRESDGSFAVDDDVVVLWFPELSEGALELSNYRERREFEWQSRCVSELPAPSILFMGPTPDSYEEQCGPSSKIETYTVWGIPGSADSRLDLLQGDIGNCGVLAAIDALVNEDPYKHLQHCINEDKSPEISVQLFDPATLEECEWKLCSPTCRKSISWIPAMVDVAAGSVVPRFARSVSNRSWGLILEAALADVAGSYMKLHECEPGVAWLALLGSEATVRRYWRLRTAEWECRMPAVTKSKPDLSLPIGSSGSQPPKIDKSSWERASEWKDTQVKLGDAGFETLLETCTMQGMALVLYPIGSLSADKDLGEPCVPLQVYFGQDIQSLVDECRGAPRLNRAECTTTRFLVGHAYSIRAVSRAPSVNSERVNELWLRLRDPRRVRLFWVPWTSVLSAADGKCSVYTCDCPRRYLHCTTYR